MSGQLRRRAPKAPNPFARPVAPFPVRGTPGGYRDWWDDDPADLVRSAASLLEYEPARVAGVIDLEYKRQHIDVVIECLTAWAQRVEDEMPGDGLRLISGGRA